MMTWLDRNRHFIFISLLFATVAGLGGFYLSRPAAQPIEISGVASTPTLASTPAPAPTPSPTPGFVRVYVTGAVVNSDVYTLPEGSIIKNAILAAGGLTPDADPVRINQASEVQDQQQIHIPHLAEENPPPPVQGGSTADEFSVGGDSQPEPGSGLININTASLDQLDTLPGIGPVIAQRIIDYRESIGGFPSIEAITEVSGIGEATFGKIKERITVE